MIRELDDEDYASMNNDVTEHAEPIVGANSIPEEVVIKWPATVVVALQ